MKVMSHNVHESEAWSNMESRSQLDAKHKLSWEILGVTAQNLLPSRVYVGRFWLAKNVRK